MGAVCASVCMCMCNCIYLDINMHIQKCLLIKFLFKCKGEQMQKGENQVFWSAIVTEAVTVFRFKIHCGNPGLILGTCIQLSFLHLVLQV